MPPRLPRRLAGRIWVTCTSLLIAFIAYSSQICIIYPWYGSELSVDLLLLLGPFNILVGFLYWNYYLCVRTDPGGVPDGWEPNLQGEDGYEIKTLTRKPRYCRYCENYKPPRAHHCKQCKRCVLRMDHHCPWVDNCVGHYNYAHFIRFLCLVDITCSYHLIMVTLRIWDAVNLRHWEPAPIDLIFMALNYVTCVPVLAIVGIFSLYHLYCLFTNTTTIEGWEKDKVTTLVKRGKIREVKFPYDIGPVTNFVSIFGSNPLLWCWPLYEVPTSGLKFPVADGHETTEQYVWPPKDPYATPLSNQDPDDEDANDVYHLDGKSPWTYRNGDLNPDLVPSSGLKRRQEAMYSAVPPYHPSYGQTQENGGWGDGDETDSASSGGDYTTGNLRRRYASAGGTRVRRGSYGEIEVRAMNREEMLKKWIDDEHEGPPTNGGPQQREMNLSHLHEQGRYQTYTPEVASDTLDEDSSEEEQRRRLGDRVIG